MSRLLLLGLAWLSLPRAASALDLADAAELGDVDKVKELLERGAGADSESEGDIPLTEAALGGHAGVLEQLLKAGADPNSMDGDGTTPVTACIEDGHATLLEKLLSARADPNRQMARVGKCKCNSPVNMAAYRGHLKMLRMLLEAGADPNSLDGGGETPLVQTLRHWDWAHGHRAHRDRNGTADREEAVQLLLSTRAEVSKAATYGRQHIPLTAAADGGLRRELDLLLDARAYVNQLNGLGRTALMRAALRGHTESVEVLLESKADVMFRDRGMQTASSLAALHDHKRMMELLEAAAPKGLAYWQYQLMRPQFWVSVLAGLLGAAAIQALQRGQGARRDESSGAESERANQIPQGAWLLAAKENKLHELSMRLRRFVEIMACVVLPFGYFMTIVHPMLVFALYSVVIVLPALRIHGLDKLVRKPVLMVATVSQLSALLRCAAMFLVARCLGFPDPESVPELAQNPRRTAVLDKRIWNDTMWSMICWGQTAQTVVFALYASWSALQCCHEFDQASAMLKSGQHIRRAEHFLEVKALAEEIAVRHAAGGAKEGASTGGHGEGSSPLIDTPRSGSVLLGAGGLEAFRDRSSVDSMLAFTVVDNLLDCSSIFLLLTSQNYIFSALLVAVVITTWAHAVLAIGLRGILDERAKSIRLGYLTDRLHDLIDAERGFEAFFSLALTSYGFIFSISTPSQVFVQGLSLMCSAWSLSLWVYEHVDLDLEFGYDTMNSEIETSRQGGRRAYI